MMKTDTVNQVKELITPFQPDFLEPTAEADIVFSSSEDLTTLCRNFGWFFYPELPDPSKCHMVKPGENVKVGENSSAIIKAIDFRGKLCEKPFSDLDCQLVSAEKNMSCRVKRKEAGLYEIHYSPSTCETHQLHITSQGQHIAGSPFNIEIKGKTWLCSFCTFINNSTSTLCDVCNLPRQA